MGPLSRVPARSSGWRSPAVTTPNGRACGLRWGSPTGPPIRAFDDAASRLANARRCSTRRSANGRVADTKDEIAERCQRARRPGGADAHRHRHGHAPALRGARLRDPDRPAGARRDGARRRRVPRRPHGGPDVRGAPAIGEHTREISTSVARARRRRGRQAARDRRARDHAARRHAAVVRQRARRDARAMA